MRGYGGGGGHYSKYTQQVSFREPGQTDGRTLERKFLNGGYNIKPPLFKVAGYKKEEKKQKTYLIFFSFISQLFYSHENCLYSVKSRVTYSIGIMLYSKVKTYY